MIRLLPTVLKNGRNLCGILLLLSALSVAPSIAQNTVEKSEERISSSAEKAASEEELETLRQNLEKAAQRQKRLETEIKRLDQDRGAINRALIQTAKSAQELERQIIEQEEQLKTLAASRIELRRSLSGKHKLLSEVLAALQRMGKNPPPAILVRPEDALTSVRSAILLGAVVPEIRTERDTLFAELKELSQVSQQIEDQKTSLAMDLNALAEDESRLSLLVQKKNGIAEKSRGQLVNEQKRAEELAGKAQSLEELIQQLETKIETANRAARAAKEADDRRKRAEQARLAKARDDIAKGNIPMPLEPGEQALQLDPAFANNSRIEPAIAFAEAKGLLPRPVSGPLLRSYGIESDTGSKQPNIALGARPNSRVRSPSDAWIVYAGPFRSYGSLIILNAGGGYHVVLSGIDSVNVSPGQFVLAGEPIGRMGITKVATTGSVDLSSAQPVLYVEFRKDGTSIDPTPWWADVSKKEPNDDS